MTVRVLKKIEPQTQPVVWHPTQTSYENIRFRTLSDWRFME